MKPWPRHLPDSLDYPAVGLDVVLASVARTYGDRIAFVDGAETLTFAQLANKATRLACALNDRGIGQGDVVALQLPNSLWHPVAYFGVVCSGAAAAPLNPLQPTTALATQLAEVGATALITHPAAAGRLDASLVAGFKAVLEIPATSAAPATGAGELPIAPTAITELLADGLARDRPRRAPGSLAHLQMTGGTTGRPKGVRVLHRNLLAHGLQQTAWRTGHLPEIDTDGMLRLRPAAEDLADYPLTPGTGVQVCVAPLFHGLALCGQLLNLLTGTTSVLPGRFDPHQYLALVEQYGATSIVGAPAFYHALLGALDESPYDTTSVRATYCGGAPIDATTLARLRRGFPRAVVGEGYGLSEATGSLVSTLVDRESANPPGTVGLPVPDVQLEIRGADGEPLPTGETGEIWARGPQITDGYQGAPALTDEQFRDGWLHTGDVGSLDTEGFLYLRGRSKDLVIYKGYNVYPKQLEEVLAEHPAVAQSAVVGVPKPEVGEIPRAFVLLRPGASVTPEDLMAFVADRVAPYQRVREVALVDSFPLSATGKVLKAQLPKGDLPASVPTP